MILKEYIKAHRSEFEKAVSACIEEDMERPTFRHDEDRAAERARRTEAYRRFTEEFMSLEPHCSDDGGVIFLLPMPDEDTLEPVYDIYIFDAGELKDYTPVMQDVDFDSVKDDPGKLDGAFLRYFGLPFLIPYGYWCSPWEEWLALEVDEASFEKYGVVKGLSRILFEMKFIGMDRVTREHEMEKLGDAEEAVEKTGQAPKTEKTEADAFGEEDVPAEGNSEDGTAGKKNPGENPLFTENIKYASVCFAVAKDAAILAYQRGKDGPPKTEEKNART